MGFSKRKSNGECCSPTLLVVLCRDGSVMEQYERMGKVETDASSEMPVVCPCVALIESFENLVHLVLRYALAAIANGDSHVFVIVTYCNHNTSACRGIFESV